MGNNDEIRQRMETYRSILLVINWIVSVIGIIAGFILIELIEGYAAIVIIISVIIGVIGHFLINVALAIPFILLNNGDILESIKRNKISQEISIDENIKKYEIEEDINNSKNKENNIRILFKTGWSIEEIAKTMKISIQEIESVINSQ